MSRKKLEHFDEMKEWGHVFEAGEVSGEDLKGTWGERVVLELGCGRGHYTVGLAERLPDTKVIGVDIKGARMWHGAKIALDNGLKNAAFLRTRIEDLENFFNEGEVDEIWITFPDPHPREGRAKKRLTSPRFLEIYKVLLKKDGVVHLKTDAKFLYDYSCETVQEEGWTILEQIEDVHGGDAPEVLHEVKTQYEERYIGEGKPIYYLRFSL